MVDLNFPVWLKAEDIGQEATLTFIDEGSNVPLHEGGDKEDKEVFEIGVKLPNGDTRRWTMNLTSQRAVAQTYGMNTKLWIGKPAVVFTVTQNVSGVMKQVIYARVPAKAS